jgi:hypothetical protein
MIPFLAWFGFPLHLVFLAEKKKFKNVHPVDPFFFFFFFVLLIDSVGHVSGETGKQRNNKSIHVFSLSIDISDMTDIDRLFFSFDSAGQERFRYVRAKKL